MSAHLSEWTLRRLHVGELPPTESQRAREHMAACAECHGVLKGFEATQARFKAEVPFERFAAGVERILKEGPVERARPRLNGLLVAVAATVLLAVTVRPFLPGSPGGNRLKGGASAELVIGGKGPQRTVQPGNTGELLPGEQIRLGYVAGTYRYVLAVSVDEAGVVSSLYPESGPSLPVEAGAGTHWLPDSVAFTPGGTERVVVVLSEKPLEAVAVAAEARRAWESAGRKVEAMTSLGVDGEEKHWLLRKP